MKNSFLILILLLVALGSYSQERKPEFLIGNWILTGIKKCPHLYDIDNQTFKISSVANDFSFEVTISKDTFSFYGNPKGLFNRFFKKDTTNYSYKIQADTIYYTRHHKRNSYIGYTCQIENLELKKKDPRRIFNFEIVKLDYNSMSIVISEDTPNNPFEEKQKTIYYFSNKNVSDFNKIENDVINTDWAVCTKISDLCLFDTLSLKKEDYSIEEGGRTYSYKLKLKKEPHFHNTYCLDCFESHLNLFATRYTVNRGVWQIDHVNKKINLIDVNGCEVEYTLEKVNDGYNLIKINN